MPQDKYDRLSDLIVERRSLRGTAPEEKKVQVVSADGTRRFAVGFTGSSLVLDNFVHAAQETDIQNHAQFAHTVGEAYYGEDF